MPANDTFAPLGELAQLVERLHGMQEVSGSTPLFSTSFKPRKGLFLINIFCSSEELACPEFTGMRINVGD